MNKLAILAAAAALLALDAGTASADGFKANPYNGPTFGHGGGIFRKQPLPAFQAAPWYLYFPYNAHFQTPAPLYGAPWYGPAVPGPAGLVNPYFPNPYPAAGYGPAPVAPGLPAAPAPAPTK